MTATELTTGTDLATTIGETAAALLPAESGWSVLIPTPDTALPEGALVAAGIQAGDHVLSIVMTEAMAARLVAATPDVDDIATGLTSAFHAIGRVLGVEVSDEVVELDPVAVAEETPDHALLASLVDGDQLQATVIITPPSAPTGSPAAASFEPIVGNGAVGAASSLEVLHDVQMGVTAELGRTRMLLRDILSLAPGSVIELDRAASAPVDVMVNGTLIAKGEVVVIDEEFGIRITEIAGYEAPRAPRHADRSGDAR